MNEADVKELVAWKESALKQLGKADALKEILPPQYLGWDVYDAVIDYVGKLLEAASPIWGVRVGPNVVRTPDGNLIELHTTGGTMQSTEGKQKRQLEMEWIKARRNMDGWTVGRLIQFLEQADRLDHLAELMHAYYQSDAQTIEKLRRADKMAEIVDQWVESGELDARSKLADARLLYGKPFQLSGAGSPEETKPEPDWKALCKKTAKILLDHMNDEDYELSLAGIYAMLTEDELDDGAASSSQSAEPTERGCIHCTEKNGLHRGDCPNGLAGGAESKAEAQRAAGLRTIAKPGEPGSAAENLRERAEHA